MRYRKNIDCLGTEELHDLREALSAIYALPASDPGSFARIAGFHGGPPVAYCRHGAPGFFTWHRAYLVAFENALRSQRCNVMVPFWDWSSGPTTGVPDACRRPTYVNRSGATVPNPLYRGPNASGGQTARRSDIDTTAFDDLSASALAAMSATTFASFQSQVNGVHGGVHVRVGGDMGSVPTASYDPIFYLHHANVDRLWAAWQASHPGPLPAGEASFELPPFSRPFSTAWQRGSDVESTDALGYRYRRFCFAFPPIRIWEVALIELPWTIRERLQSARLVVKADRMQTQSMEIRAFLNQPRATARTKTIGNPAFVGAVGFLGHPETPAKGGDGGGAHCHECGELGHTREHARHASVALRHAGHDHGQPASAERFDLELDVTAALRAFERDAAQLSLKLVAVDPDGGEVAPEQALIEDVELVVE